MSFHAPRVIDTARLRLRSWRVTDAPVLQAVLGASEAHLRAWTPWVVDGRDPSLGLEDRLAAHAAAFAEDREWVYGLFTPDERSILGACGLYPRIGAGALELGYWLAADATGRGYATEAAAALVGAAFASPAVARVEIRCDARNAASLALARRLGFRRGDDGVVTVHGRAHALAIWNATRDGAVEG